MMNSNQKYDLPSSLLYSFGQEGKRRIGHFSTRSSRTAAYATGANAYSFTFIGKISQLRDKLCCEWDRAFMSLD